MSIKQCVDLVCTKSAEVELNAIEVAQNAALAEASKNAAAQSALEADTAKNEAVTKANEILEYVIPSGTAKSIDQSNTDRTAMSKAAFNAIASNNRDKFGGSGFVEFGKHLSATATYPNVNEGIVTYTNQPNLFFIGEEANSAGTSKTYYPQANINGVISRMQMYTSGYQANTITLPNAPTVLPYTATLTAEQIASGVIKHADASNSGLIVNGKFYTDTSGWTAVASTLAIVGNQLEVTATGTNGSTTQSIPTVVGKKYVLEAYIKRLTNTAKINITGMVDYIITNGQDGRISLEFIATATATSIGFNCYYNATTMIVDNIAVFPADAISRQDLVFLESWHEDVSEKDFVYPLGNTQYLGADTDGLTGIANGAFAGFGTYSLFGNWQASSALIGKGYVWSTRTEAQKKAFLANPENNCYLDGDKVIQVRYRMRVVQGWGDSWTQTETELQNLSYSLSDGYVKPKGKLVSITYDLSTYTIYESGLFSRNNRFGLNSIGSWKAASKTLTDNDTTVAYEGKCFALPIALVHRRNQGMYHPVYNANGTKLASDSLPWYNTTVAFTNIADCFTESKLLTTSGYIGTTSGIQVFYDQIHEGDITDLRVNARKLPITAAQANRELAKAASGVVRGSEGEWASKTFTSSGANHLYIGSSSTTIYISDTSRFFVGDIIHVSYVNGTTYYRARVLITTISTNTNIIVVPIATPITNAASLTFHLSAEMILSYKSTRTKSNTLTHCDIIGNPANYPTAWKQSGVSGVPLIVAEDGTSLLPTGTTGSDGIAVFKLSKKANATPLQVLKSTDSGVTWTALTVTTHYTFSTTTNAITFTAGNIPLVAHLIMVTYQTHTIMAVPAVNSEVLVIGDVWAGNSAFQDRGNFLFQSLLNKIGNTTTTPRLINGNKEYTIRSWFDNVINNTFGISHSAVSFENNSPAPAVKVLPYLTRANGKAYLNLVFKEMKYNGTSWGDDSKFNIVDNVSTTVDNNGQVILIGQKRIELPYFIGAGE